MTCYLSWGGYSWLHNTGRDPENVHTDNEWFKNFILQSLMVISWNESTGLYTHQRLVSYYSERAKNDGIIETILGIVLKQGTWDNPIYFDGVRAEDCCIPSLSIYILLCFVRRKVHERVHHPVLGKHFLISFLSTFSEGTYSTLTIRGWIH